MVTTGQKISSVIVMDLGSLLKVTVGWIKYPFESSPVSICNIYDIRSGKGEKRQTRFADEDLTASFFRFLNVPHDFVVRRPATVDLRLVSP